MRLYDLPAAFAGFEQRLELTGGELTDDLAHELTALEAAEADKIEGVAILISEAKAEAAYFEAELKRLQERRDVARNRAERLTSYLHGYLDQRGFDAYRTPRFRVRRQRNSVPTVRFLGHEIPHPYRVTHVELDKAAVLRDYKAHVAAHGEDTARELLPDGLSVEYGTHLRIA